MPNLDPVRFQRDYYTRTASEYAEWHVHEDDEHGVALRYVSSLIASEGIRSVLDVGCGTGRAARHVAARHPDVRVVGLEPVHQLVVEARRSAAGVDLLCGSGLRIPFPDRSFDAVIEVGVLHHVANPNRMVAEMTRVARKAVFLSDTNRFGCGRRPIRLGKLVAARLGIWPLLYRLRTRGHGYCISDGDGLAYSYSVYDSFSQLTGWAERVFAVPTGRMDERPGWLHPLLTSSHVLLCAFRVAAEMPAPDSDT
jgi:SAM-dependent methyltransferase